MVYHICNNYNVSEQSTSDYDEALVIAQSIANRDDMPAWIDLTDSARTTIKVEPMSSKAMLDGARSVASDVLRLHKLLTSKGVQGTEHMNLAQLQVAYAALGQERVAAVKPGTASEL